MAVMALSMASCDSPTRRAAESQKEEIVLEKIPMDSVISMDYIIYGKTRLIQFNKDGYIVTLTGIVSNVEDTVFIHKISSLKRMKR